MKTYFKQRPIEIEIENIDYYDAPDFVDAFISSATWLDTKIEFTEKELDEINDGGIHEYVDAWIH